MSLSEQLKTGTPQLSICPLTGNTMNPSEDLALLENAGVKLLHLDVMDGNIWPKITVGSGYLAGLKTSLLKDVHLLIDKPEKHISDFAAAGADIITFCAEYTDDIGAVLELIGNEKNVNDESRGILRGVSLNPTTPLEVIHPHLANIDLVLLLAIEPDTGKDTYFDRIPLRIAQLREWNETFVIVVDGAVKKDNVGEIAAMGPDLIATGSAVFDGNDVDKNIFEMNQSIKESI